MVFKQWMVVKVKIRTWMSGFDLKMLSGGDVIFVFMITAAGVSVVTGGDNVGGLHPCCGSRGEFLVSERKGKVV